MAASPWLRAVAAIPQLHLSHHARSKKITTSITRCGDVCSPRLLLFSKQNRERAQRTAIREGSRVNTSDKPTAHPHQPGDYQIRVEGQLDSRWSAWFDGLRLSPQEDGTTVIEGAVVDQAALHGLLQKVRNLGLPLISVSHIETDTPEDPSKESC